MATAIERTLRDQGILLCEAGTGTGKTLGYLIPALLSRRKVIISTATRALQDQIAYHDLPRLARALKVEPSISIMKGLANYVCRTRYEQFKNSAESLRPGYAHGLRSLDSWVQETSSGDISELVSLAEDNPIWREVTSSSETRIGAQCEHFEECFITRMKREAEAARIVIVNHHLFFADLSLRGNHPGRVLPNYDAVIFDEAHQIEDIATHFFGTSVSKASIDNLAKDSEQLFKQLSSPGRSSSQLGEGPLFQRSSSERITSLVSVTNQNLFTELGGRFRGAEGRVHLEADLWRGELTQCWHALDDALEVLCAELESAHARAQELTHGSLANLANVFELFARKAQTLRDDLTLIIEGGPGRITWLDLSGKSPKLVAALVDVAPLLRERIFKAIPSVVLTSATLTSVGSSSKKEPQGAAELKYLRSRVGLNDEALAVEELIIPSPFDFSSSAMLYTPADLPDPRDPRFLNQVVNRVTELCRITQGGAFVLTTSLRSMQAIHRGLMARLPELPLFLQGESPKANLLGRFKATPNSVLVATLSFWEGVDVPGDALRLVVLEKIPFAVPSDPLVQARSLSLETHGRNAFMELHVPQAAITLKQGFGRLIRNHTDRGIVALLDERVHSKGYGKKLLSALPPAQRSSELSQVEQFWRGLNHPNTAPKL